MKKGKLTSEQKVRKLRRIVLSLNDSKAEKVSSKISDLKREYVKDRGSRTCDIYLSSYS